jgi:hypothetical protein
MYGLLEDRQLAYDAVSDEELDDMLIGLLTDLGLNSEEIDLFMADIAAERAAGETEAAEDAEPVYGSYAESDECDCDYCTGETGAEVPQIEDDMGNRHPISGYAIRDLETGLVFGFTNDASTSDEHFATLDDALNFVTAEYSGDAAFNVIVYKFEAAAFVEPKVATRTTLL